jgi:hypothetical protein
LAVARKGFLAPLSAHDEFLLSLHPERQAQRLLLTAFGSCRILRTELPQNATGGADQIVCKGSVSGE